MHLDLPWKSITINYKETIVRQGDRQGMIANDKQFCESSVILYI